MGKRLSSLAAPLLVTSLLASFTQLAAYGSENHAASRPPKMLIEYGWDMPHPQDLHDHIAEWQDRPFDGIVFSLNRDDGDLFERENFDPNAIKRETKLLTALNWGRFKDNFLLLSFETDMKWDSDADWKQVLARADLCAKAAKAAGCKGFILDPKSYLYTDAWDYRIQCIDKTVTLAQYSAIVRRRGRQLIRVLQRQLPHLTILIDYELSEPLDPFSSVQGNDNRVAVLSANPFGLLPPFLDGMLEASNSDVHFIGGNHESLFYVDPAEFPRSKQYLVSNEAECIAPELRRKFQRQFRTAQGVFTDYIYGLRPPEFLATPAAYLTRGQRDVWFEDNLYSAMNSSDEYVWLFNQSFRWWPVMDNRLPEIKNTIESVDKKVIGGLPLGLDIKPVIDAMSAHQGFSQMGLK